jgi:hypothetical protein
MKLLLLAIFILSFNQFGFSQEASLKTFSGKPVDKNTCIFQIEFVDLVSKDSLNNTLVKPKIEKLVDYLSSCDSKFIFDTGFHDKSFKIIVPKYLSEVSYELGNQKFAIVLRDTTSSERTIVFSYDLDDSYKKHFLSHDNMGFKKVGTLKLNEQTIHRFINWDDRIAGTIFSSNHLHISYFTKSKDSEVELEEVVSKFNW